MNQPSKKKIIVITGAGRCGTKFFGTHLQSLIDDCYSVHEPDTLYARDPDLYRKLLTFGPYQLVLGKLLRRRGLRLLSVKAATGQLRPQQVIDRLQRERHGYYSSIDADCVAEANCSWWGITDYLHTLAGDYRVAAIVRDPIAWVRSWRQHTGWHDSRDRVARLKLGRLGHPDWGNDPVHRLAHTWTFIYGRLQRCAETDKRQQIFRFEDLFGRDEVAFAGLLDFLSFNGTSTVHHSKINLRLKAENASEALAEPMTGKQIDAIQRICGELAQSFGYDGYES